ncbi:glycosyltransferase [Cryobacterium sp. BB307]|uniref:glycosyltransferase n=1 Tax=Cryobacterium sp. BB307 TaxID=2716317 RepID=UPI0014477DAA|nr:glycosyltransferase [Cryobacterium sp. BB307]
MRAARIGPSPVRLAVIRVVTVVAVALGINYIAWRWLDSLNWEAWWIAVPLVVAETYSLIDVSLFAMTVWKARGRPAPPPPPDSATVDVFITTYNEPIELVLDTVRAALGIRYPHSTWVLDDGARPELEAELERLGVGYITRGDEWLGKPRHAKAGNLNNALMATSGEFILVLDADQVPKSDILDKVLGYFTDDALALVQTPQVFSNVAPGDPLGSQAPLFYGPILQGKDGWNAAFFCGSNAVLRREALMQLGVVAYVREVDRSVATALRAASVVIAKARRHPSARSRAVARALRAVQAAVGVARKDLRSGTPLAEVTYQLEQKVNAVSAAIVASDFASVSDDLRTIRRLAGEVEVPEDDFDIGAAISALSSRELSPMNALEAVHSALQSIAVDRPDEAQPLMPLATISVTEDMATSMRLHRMGWKSVYHHEKLADGLAPEDLGTMLTQRLRWAQGTMQVFLRENPLVQRGMSLAQRLMYFSTMWSYLSGFAAVVYFAGPAIFLLFGVLPVNAISADFAIRFVPFMIVNQLLFLFAARGVPTWRGQQYSLALFPVWINACWTAFRNVVFSTPLDFAVTPKTRQASTRQWWRIRWQLLVMAVLVVSLIVGGVRLVAGDADLLGTVVNVAWAVFDLIVLNVVLTAARHRAPETFSPM